ncbi:MAG TPA: DUF4389 domain-containing protein [Thermoleophilia bacterium]|nr:DUF4389 domain-containing protein [Thermoleophilia bacterium]
MNDYPVSVRIERAPRNSRVWAVLAILTIKFIALIPHFIVLAILGIAQFIAFVIAQVVVLVNGTYPRSLHDFVAGVVRWQLRVGAFFLSMTDRYPPFTLEERDDYPVGLKVEYPERNNRLLAGLTVLVLLIAFVSFGFARHQGGLLGGWSTWSNLRAIAQIPHYIVLALYGIGVAVVWFVAQFVILVVGRTGDGIHGFIERFVRWSTRVSAFTYGLTDRYPPFSGQPGPGEDLAPTQPSEAPGGTAAAA